MLEKNKIYNGDCLEIMKSIDDKSIDMILCDLPYGTTACKWDVIIPFEPLWEQYKRIIKDNGAIVLTAGEPFASRLICSALSLFKYKFIWKKDTKSNFFQVDYAPLKIHEEIIVFSKSYARHIKEKSTIKYNPQMTEGKKYKLPKVCKTSAIMSVNHKNGKCEHRNNNTANRFPSSIIEFNTDKNNIHPTQKPVALFEYLIKTYTNENEMVLDNCSGSGTTAIACINTNRNYICIEKDKTYFDKSVERVEKHLEQNNFKLAI